ncbi:glycosyltransferase [Bradyrhizobium sp. 182]|uniref:glycosyltransferase family protein n=1 Tax=unclassified Bradyrhizobium TaxID=2631580 RepID=UPI001FFB28B5|nr:MULTISPECIES: glycosyltransferase [unclassified Bradyrhizobium]MCK1422396.1 glycosyltransferase [Bradyrhizobium sp. CW12]MCK1527909.1 glycosyltransferase [Bradyrhizobium sp. 182]MCK1649058.1 glycosyltransferase [Bradyrhizobium sp. 154]
MRLFQNNGLSRGFRAHRRETPYQAFVAGRAQFLHTRFTASHILLPVLTDDPDAFYANGDDERLQLLWAKENNLRTDDLEQILLAQIEQHRTEVFYNLDPIRYCSKFVAKLPGCVKKSIAWRAAPSGNADLTKYDLVVCNFASILDNWRQKGCKVAHFSPAHDPVMDTYANARAEEFDLIFIGGYTRHHVKRSQAMRAAASTPGVRARFYLEDSRLTRLANALAPLPVLRSYRHPNDIRSIRAGPVYGRDAYAAMAKSRMVFNGAIDMAGGDRGNMRCFETLGCGAVLLTDAGRYPEGFVDGETMLVYSSPAQVPELIGKLMKNEKLAASIAGAGHTMVKERYSKALQWTKFQDLI